MRKTLTILYALLAVACAGYYILIGVSARFGLSMSAIWLALSAVFALAAALNAWRKTPRWLRIAMREVFAIGLAALIALEGMVFSGMRAQPEGHVDYLIVLGARVERDGPSPALRRRLNAALEYLNGRPETKVVASGGQGADEPVSEAECIRSELVAAGIGNRALSSRINRPRRRKTCAIRLKRSAIRMRRSRFARTIFMSGGPCIWRKRPALQMYRVWRRSIRGIRCFTI